MTRSYGVEINSRKGKASKELNEFFLNEEFCFDHYEGEIVDGMRDGNGLFVFTDGSFYSGQWKNNKPSGLGMFHYADGKYDTGVYKVLYL